MDPQVPDRRVTARVAGAEDVDVAAAVLARAFQDDPAMTWMFPDADDRRVRLVRLFASSARSLYLPHGHVYVAGEVGAAFWAPPGKGQMGFFTTLRLAPKMVRVFGRALRRALQAMNLMQAHHPPEPHYYLFAVGTDPAAQGQGIGSSLLAPVLARCDAEGRLAHLENSNPRNTPFYRRHGFEPKQEITLPKGPPILVMTRPPRPSR